MLLPVWMAMYLSLLNLSMSPANQYPIFPMLIPHNLPWPLNISRPILDSFDFREWDNLAGGDREKVAFYLNFVLIDEYILVLEEGLILFALLSHSQIWLVDEF